MIQKWWFWFDKEHSGQPKKFKDTELQALLNENSVQTLEELIKVLNVDISIVFDRLPAMENIQKKQMDST